MLLPALSGLIKSLRALISLSVHWEWPPLLLLLCHSPFGLLPCHRHCFLCTELLMMWQIIIASSRLPNCRQFSVSKEGEQAQWDTHTHTVRLLRAVCVECDCCAAAYRNAFKLNGQRLLRLLLTYGFLLLPLIGLLPARVF